MLAIGGGAAMLWRAAANEALLLATCVSVSYTHLTLPTIYSV